MNRQIARVKHVFKWGAEEEIVPGSVYHALSAVRQLQRGRCEVQDTEPVKPVDQSVLDAVVEHLNPTVAAMVRVQSLSGMRPGEVCRMQRDEIDTSGDVWVYRPTDHKTAHHGKQREVPIGPRAQAILRPFVLASAGPIFKPKLHVRPRKTPLNQGNRPRPHKRKLGDFYTVASYRRAIERACTRAGVERFHPNQIRHTAATRIRREHGLDAARVILGHSSTRTTEVYAEVDGKLGSVVALAAG